METDMGRDARLGDSGRKTGGRMEPQMNGMDADGRVDEGRHRTKGLKHLAVDLR
jgi:hypothetical protein